MPLTPARSMVEGGKTFASDAERVAFLFELYHKYTSPLPASEVPKRTKRKKV
jgi:hypothetical protein